MSIHKTQIGTSQVEGFLRKRLDVSNISVQLMSDGESSAAFSYHTKDGGQVIRISKHGKESFLKDRFAHTHFTSSELPIPTILMLVELLDHIIVGKYGSYSLKQSNGL